MVCSELNKPLIHFSTNCIFDGEKGFPYTEEDRPTPISIYGRTKTISEYYIKKYHSNHVILRSCWNFSEHEGHNFLLKILRIAKKQGWLNVVDDQFGCPTSSYRVAEVVIQLIKQWGSVPCGVYNYCSSERTDWYHYTKEIFKHVSHLGLENTPIKPVKTGQVPTLVKRPRDGSLDCQKIQVALNIKLPNWRTDIEKAVKNVVVF